MKRHIVIFAVTSLVSMWVMAGAANAWRESDLRATITAPSEVRLDKTNMVPITVEVANPDGLPFSGQVELSPSHGRFVGSEGTYFPVTLEAGRVDATVSLGDTNDWPSPLTIWVTKGDEVLGKIDVKIRYHDYIDVTAVRPTVLADGAGHPVIQVAIRDQFGEPLPEAEVTARFRGPRGARSTLPATTGPDGTASVYLPASDTPGYSLGQVLTDRLASRMVTVLYAPKDDRAVDWNDPTLVMIPAEEVNVASFVGPIVFPTEAQQAAGQATARDEVREQCMGLLSRVLKPESIPPDLAAHLIPVRRWADGRDALVVRYSLGDRVVQIVYSRSEMTLVVAPAQDRARAPRDARLSLIEETLNRLLTVPAFQDLHARASDLITVGNWGLAANTALRGSIMDIRFATDGRFVALGLVRSYGGAVPRPATIERPLFGGEAAAPPPTPIPPPEPAQPNISAELTPEELANEVN